MFMCRSSSEASQGKLPLSISRSTSFQPIDDCCGVLFADNALAGQHTGVSHRSGNILPVEPPVIVNGNSVG